MNDFLEKKNLKNPVKGKATSFPDPFNDPRLALLENISNIIGATLDFKKLLFIVVDSAVSVMRAESGALYFIDLNNQKVFFETGTEDSDIRADFKAGKGISGWV